METAPPPLAPNGRTRAVALSRRLTVVTLTYNLIELVVAVVGGVAASSAALVGFGLDSAIESSASLILLWRLSRETELACSQPDDEVAQRLIAVSFGVLALWVGQESLTDLVAGDRPDVSVLGIGLAAASLAVMPYLAWSKRRLAPLLGSRAAQAESTQTLLCAYMSGALLLGLSANALLGWWWADPLSGLVIASLAGREAVVTWRADSLADTCCG